MLWIAIAAGSILFTLFLFFRLRDLVKKIGREVFY
jgi:hypothetical protein